MAVIKKYSFFGYIIFFFNEKSLMIRIFNFILDFGKKPTHKNKNRDSRCFRLKLRYIKYSRVSLFHGCIWVLYTATFWTEIFFPEDTQPNWKITEVPGGGRGGGGGRYATPWMEIPGGRGSKVEVPSVGRGVWIFSGTTCWQYLYLTHELIKAMRVWIIEKKNHQTGGETLNSYW